MQPTPPESASDRIRESPSHLTTRGTWKRAGYSWIPNLLRQILCEGEEVTEEQGIGVGEEREEAGRNGKGGRVRSSPTVGRSKTSLRPFGSRTFSFLRIRREFLLEKGRLFPGENPNRPRRSEDVEANKQMVYLAESSPHFALHATERDETRRFAF